MRRLLTLVLLAAIAPLAFGAAGDVSGTRVLAGGGYGSTGATIDSSGVGQFNGALTTDGALTADSAAIGGGYGSTGASISDAGVGQFNGALTTDGAVNAASAVVGSGTIDIGGVASNAAFGNTAIAARAIRQNPNGDTVLNIATGRTLYFYINGASSGTSWTNTTFALHNSLTVGGGYGSTGASISDAGVGQFNGALTTDGALTSDSGVFGGGFGSTGATIANTGNISTDGDIVLDGGNLGITGDTALLTFASNSVALDGKFTLGANIIHDEFNSAKGIHIQNQTAGQGTRVRLMPKVGFGDTVGGNLEVFGTDFENSSTNYWNCAFATRISNTLYPGHNGDTVVMIDAKGAGTFQTIPPDLLFSFNHALVSSGSREALRLIYDDNTGAPYTAAIFSSDATTTGAGWLGSASEIAQFDRNILIANTYGVLFRGADAANDWGLRLTSGDVLTFKTDNADTVTIASTGAITSGSDTDITTTLGRGKIGSPSSDNMYLAHFDNLSTTDYALLQTAAGTTVLNAKSGGTVNLRVNNTSGTQVSLSGSLFTVSNAMSVTGNTTLGDASTDTITLTGRVLPRQVTDAGPMTATGGTQTEVVWNTSDSKLYVCTVTHASAATWVALH